MRLPRYRERMTGPMESAVEQALAAAVVAPADQGTTALAREYARLIDAAAPAARYTQALEWVARQGPGDKDADRHVQTITAALAAHSVASDLGPKLLAALDALLMSPRARAAAKKAVIDAKPAANPLDQLAAARARKGRAPGVDPGAEGSI